MIHGFLTVFWVVERENLVEFFISPKVSTIQFEYFLALLNDHDTISGEQTTSLVENAEKFCKHMNKMQANF